MKRSYRLIGILLSFINEADDPPIGVDEFPPFGDLIQFDADCVGSPIGSETIEFKGFDKDIVYSHYLAMLHGGLVFKHEWEDHGVQKHAIRLTTKGYDLLDEYQKWMS